MNVLIMPLSAIFGLLLLIWVLTSIQKQVVFKTVLTFVIVFIGAGIYAGSKNLQGWPLEIQAEDLPETYVLYHVEYSIEAAYILIRDVSDDDSFSITDWLLMPEIDKSMLRLYTIKRQANDNIEQVKKKVQENGPQMMRKNQPSNDGGGGRRGDGRNTGQDGHGNPGGGRVIEGSSLGFSLNPNEINPK